MDVVDWNDVPEVEEDSDGEDVREQNQYNIEGTLIEFEDEPSIMHNVYPESESDEDEAVRTRRRHNTIRRGDGRLYEGQIFMNGIAFKEVVLDYALRTARNLKQYRWQVKVFVSKHSCVPNGSCEMLKVPVIARLFLDKIRDEPKYFMPMKIEEIVKEKWKITVSRPQCQAARNKALRWIEKEYAEQFSRLRDYEAEILISNPNSSVEIDTITNAEGLDVFNRFYVCFDNLRKSWKATCRPLIGMDGCFIRAKMKGQLLVAMGRDVDNRIYPIAWAVVQVENKENWLWFVRKIKVDLDLGDGEGYVMVSDRHKGLIYAVNLELPNIEHRKCVRHIYMNVKAKHGKKTHMKPFIWNLAWSYNEAEFQENLDRLNNYDSGVYADVMKTDPRTWCRAFYKLGPHCEDVENNSTESWNGSIVKAREKAFVPMLATIARQAMVRIAKRDVKSHAHKGLCTPYVVNYLAAEEEKAADCTVHRSTNNTYLVDLSGCGYRVSLPNRTCTCRRWEITGIPCEHAYAVLKNKKIDAELYVSPWFHTSMWRKTYTDGLVPIRGSRFWPIVGAPPLHEPPEPAQPGRKKGKDGVSKPDTKRKKGKNESPTKKKPVLLKRIMHCKICGTANHNSRFHNMKKQPFLGESSEVQASQGEASQGTLTQI
ncbi:uncharacterized protein LOC112085211 [Eutrema salsugineum]|uniref:uncharacterized protein LOC112085211 n=1 Tax=Eutrema salsugineum TaxID=72664 RepID=UPI000CED330D|nr:uncharacterized protein LOC112085211 [Eutrema salsugineum]